jgi:hypothetical protein
MSDKINAIRKKISPILAIALISSLATSIMAIQSFTSDSTLFHVGHDSSVLPDSPHTASAASLPLPIDFHYRIKEKAGDAAEGTRYAEIDEEFINTEIHCEFCTHITVKPGPRGQAGFAYVSDEELDLSAAKSVTFFVMGGDGGEKAKFQVAGKSSSAPAEGTGRGNSNDVNASSSPPGLFKDKDFAISTEEVTLEDDWTPLSIDLSKTPKEQLRGVKYPFAIEMSQMRGAQEFFIKHVKYETEEATLNPIPAEEQGTLNATALNATALDSNATVLDSNATALNDTSVASAAENATNGDDDIIANRTSDEALTERQQEETDQTEDVENNNSAITDDNNTSTDETADETQTLADDVSPPESNRTEIDDTDDADIDQDSDETNSPPVAKANEDIMAYPGDEAILDGLESFDEDDTDRLEYEWTQSDGPDLAITDADTATPTILIPSDIDEDSEAVIDLVVSDGKDASEKDSVSVFIDHVEALEDLDEETEQVQTKELKPDSDEESQWELSECDDLVDCLSDGSDATATVAGGNGEQSIEKTDLLSFEDLGADLPNEDDVEIRYIVIEVDAHKSEETGYIRLHVDSSAADSNNGEEAYESNAISIVSGSMEEYQLVLETEPITDEEWTVESIDSIIAGYSFAGGQSEIEVSEMTIRVHYTVTAAENGEGMAEEEIEIDDDTATDSSEEEEAEVEEESSNTEESGEQQEEGSSVPEDDENAEENNANAIGNMTG